MRRLTSPDRMKLINEKNILKIVHENPGIYRKLIAEKTNLSSQTVTNLVTELVERRVLLEYAPSLGIKGRNPVSLSVNYSGFYMITADINIGRVAVYVNALDETVIASEERPVGQKTDVLDVLKEMIGRVLERAGTVTTILACAISVTGVVNEDKGIVVEAGKLNWYNLDLAGELSYLGVPVLVRNDANMFAYYEKSQFPADLNFMIAKIDVGIGSAFVLGGRVLESTNNVAGELGHVTAMAQGAERPCVCGKTNCLTKFISLEALEADYGKPYGELVEEVRRKEPKAVALIEDVCAYLAPILANVIILLDLDRIILCGCTVEYFESIIYPCLDRKIRKLLSYWVSFKRLEIRTNVKITAISSRFLLDYYFSTESDIRL